MSLLLAAALCLAAAPATASKPAAASSDTLRAGPEDRRRSLLLTELLLAEDRLAEAEQFIRERYAVDSDTRVWTVQLARLRAAQGRPGEAAELYKLLLEADPRDPGLLLAYGRHSLAAERFGEAERALSKAHGLSSEAWAAYYLSELALARERPREARRWAERALARLRRATGPDERRLSLKLRSRLAWDDELEREYGKLFDEYPKEEDTLVDWARALIRRGRPDAAREPSALLAERFPELAGRAALLEAERLRAARDPGELAFLEESARRYPAELGLRLELGQLEMRRRRWGRAQLQLERAVAAPAFQRAADELLVEARRQGHHHAGPFARWRESSGSRTRELGLVYRGYPRPRLELEAQASRGVYERRSRGTEASLTGGSVSAALERAPWTAGAALDARAGARVSAVSPGVFARWRPHPSLALEAEGFLRRAWRDSAEAVHAGTLADELAVEAEARPAPRLSVGGQLRRSWLEVEGGGRGGQTVAAPQAIAALLQYPFYVGLGYRFVAVDATGQSAFFSRLPLLRRARTHYALLSAGKHWLNGRVRTDGYVYNGHEPERGRKFGSDALVGFGLNAEASLGRWLALASYEHTREDSFGVGGRSQSLRLSLQRRWEPGWISKERKR